MTPSDGAEHRKKPTDNMIKVNVDAADFSSSNCFSFSYVARNQTGDLLEAKAKCQRGTVNPHVAEALGIREALSWIKNHNWNKVMLETYCLEAVQAIRSAAEMFSYIGRIICECKQHLIDQLRVFHYVLLDGLRTE